MNADSNRGVYFECSQCGDCCSSWNIPLEADKARVLLERPWVRERLAATRRTLTPMTTDLYRIPLTDQNTCVFLSDDRRCLVEVHEGAALKPKECRRFPFAAVKMPAYDLARTDKADKTGDIGYETSAACKKISDTLLLAFQPILPKPAESAGQEPAERGMSAPEGNELWQLGLEVANDAAFDLLETLPDRVPVSAFRTASWAAYDAWRKHLRTLFMDPVLSSHAALLKARRLLKHLPGLDSPAGSPALFPQTATSNEPDEPGGGKGWKGTTARWITLFFLRKPYRTLTWLRLCQGHFYEDPRIFGTPVDLRARRAINGNWEERAENRRLLKAFLFSLLGRRLPLTRGQSLASLTAMAACACLLVHWYAVTLAWLRNDDQAVTPTDVSLAIRLVERYYTGHQPRFLGFFSSRWKSGLIERLLLG